MKKVIIYAKDFEGWQIAARIAGDFMAQYAHESKTAAARWGGRDFFVILNKNSVTVRECEPAPHVSAPEETQRIVTA